MAGVNIHTHLTLLAAVGRRHDALLGAADHRRPHGLEGRRGDGAGVAREGGEHH